MRTIPALSLLASLAACSTSPRTVLVVSPGTELVCAARAAGDVHHAQTPDASLVASLDASSDVPPVDAAPDAADGSDAADAADAPRRALTVDAAHLALLPASTAAWTVARVLRCEGGRALVMTHDGETRSRPLVALRALNAVASLEVTALWAGQNTAYHAVVTAARGDTLHVRYDDGTEEDLSAARLATVITPQTPPPARACPPPAGTLPVVLLESASWHRTAAVVECGGPSALIDTLRDGRTLVPLASLAGVTLTRGDRVQVRWRDGNDWAARVEGVDDDGVAVTYDDGSDETIALGQVVAWSAPPGVTRTTTPYRCP